LLFFFTFGPILLIKFTPSILNGKKIIKSTRGKDKLIYEGYIYNLVRRETSFTIWRCNKKSQRCLGRIKWEENLEPVIIKEHNHERNVAEANSEIVKSVMRERAIETFEQPCQILNSITALQDDDT
jgi:hypothetical protein